MNNDKKIYLAHHGIKGQKWGVQNGPPYPLSSSLSTGKKLKKIARKVNLHKNNDWKAIEEASKEIQNQDNVKYLLNSNYQDMYNDVAEHHRDLTAQIDSKIKKYQGSKEVEEFIKKKGLGGLSGTEDAIYKYLEDKDPDFVKLEKERDEVFRDLINITKKAAADVYVSKLKDNMTHATKNAVQNILHESYEKKLFDSIEYEERRKEANKLKEVNLMDEHSNDKKRLDKAAVLGIKALNEMDKYGEKIDFNDKGEKDWFIWEDQTIGYATIADLVNQGKTKQEINKLIKTSKESLEFYNDQNKIPSGVFQLAQTRHMDNFIDACIKVKQKEKQKK